MQHSVIAIIGAGNIGRCLISGLVSNGYPCDKLWACGPSSEKLNALEDEFQIRTTTDNAKAVELADVVIFAIKPLLFSTVAQQLAKKILFRKALIISVVAGARESDIQKWIGTQTPIIRAMPNTPAIIGSGATALFANALADQTQKNIAESIFRGVGLTVWLQEEALLDTVTALSGSGPAYFFFIMETLQNAAIEQGLSPDIARLLTLQTGLGAARLAIESGKSLAELRRLVTSPGGTTEQAISVLENEGVQQAFKKALLAAKARATELGIGEKKDV
ncbi:MAG TPA: pyrroline-5-carboxylate reductase [Gammaproteobacteria bacterium]|jgi:pyrroline-5-carboxylate reductase|nr:pyrroline-5-carboxylate reductase [Gammaproteobacteria bacterium]